MTDRAIERLTMRVSRERLTRGPQIGTAHAFRATDHDGDPILDITLVAAGDALALDAWETAALTRHLRNALAAAGEEAFPVLRFVSASEAGGLRPAAA
ncbi:hypothetical protein [Salinarimonas rosea]|uniref:hypothetical protein n=1 Tax=Salinarimonas rosea TaxID=552063 RepID=UPI0012EC7FFB|nr:hypothetical protein [Salinarimonas rosea]